MITSAEPSVQNRPTPDGYDGSSDVTDRLVLPPDGLAAFIKSRPVVAVGVALLAGFIAGRIASRL